MKITLSPLAIMCLLCGFLTITSFQSVENLNVFEATITDKHIIEFTNKAGQWRSLDFKFAETDKTYGILLKKKESNQKNNLTDKFEVGKKYTFYIDPNDLKTNADSLECFCPEGYFKLGGHNLGIRMVKLNGQIIYKN